MSQTTPPAAPHPLCAVYDPLLPLLSFGELEAGEKQAVLIHAATCEWCQRQLAAYDQLSAALYQLAAPKSAAPFSLTLEDVMDASEQSPSTPPPSLPPGEPSTPRRYPGRAAGLMALVTSVLLVALAGTIFAVHGLPTNKPASRSSTPASTGKPSPSFATTVVIRQFALGTANSSTTGITVGPDHNLWFIDSGTNSIGRMMTSGQVKEYPLPASYRCDLHDAEITTGSDGALWFVEDGYAGYVAAIGRITTSGEIHEYPLPGNAARPLSIVAGPDEALWFTENSASSIGRLTTGGRFSQFTIPMQAFAPSTSPAPVDITIGPDGSLWFTDASTNAIGRITTDGVVKEYPAPTSASGLEAIFNGPDGALWFTENAAARIGRITTEGQITEYPVPSGSRPLDITAGPDGALWFTESSPSQFAGDQIGRITPRGSITELALPEQDALSPTYIVTGPDRALWFTDYGASSIGHISIEG
jgi:virginiamycin B lyase